MNYLVTGAAGFIGHHVCKKLLKEGHHVFGIDNFDPFYSRIIKEKNLSQIKGHPHFHFFPFDIRNADDLKIVFKNNIDVIIHLAAKAGVRPSIEAITDYYDVNVNGTVNVLELMKIHHVKKMIFASSSSVYGNNKKTPFSEVDFVDHPISPYASTKKSGELLCHVYCHLYNFDITCLRFFTVYGPGQRPDLAIHKFVKLIDSGQPIPFFGDGNSSRDYTYIDDIVDGIYCALNHLKGYNLYNLGESKTITLSELVKKIENFLEKKATITRLPYQDGDVIKTFADISKAKKEIAYNPKTGMNEGMKHFIKWFREN